MTERMKRVWLGVSASKWALPAMVFALGLGIVAAWAVDGDNDGIDDSFETFFGLNTGTNDAALDPDADGLDNLSESLLWTDPFWADTDRDGFSDVNDSNPVSRAFIPWGDPFFTGTNNEVLYTWPAWMVGAFKSGGDWDSNLPAWHVTAAESNPAALAIEVDRALLTNDLRLKVGLAGGLESTLYLDLYDTNGLVIVTNALDNLLTGGGTGSVRIFSIPLESNSAAVGLWLRHGTGEVTVSGSLLYVDQDGDGLDVDQERQLGTSDTALDSDQDGFSDAEEVFTYGTDPAQAFSVPYGTIQGLVSYAGVQVGTVHVMGASTATDWTSLWTATSSQPSTYNLSVPQRRTYFLRAYRDVNGNGQRDTWEPCGTAIPSSLYVISDLTGGADIVMTDPDTDGDGMSDVAELHFGFDPLVSNRYARLPFVESFETNTVTVGDIGGQNGWRVSATNAAFVQTNSVYAGSQALELNSSSDSGVTASQFFSNPATNQVWVDVHVRVEQAPVPTNRTDSASCFFFDGDNRLVVLDGLQSGTNRWVTLTNSPSLGKGSWARVSVRLDFTAQTWLVCLNGLKLAEGLGFGTPISELHSVEQSGGHANTDDLVVSAHEPSGLSIDGDTLPDDWERQYIGTTDQDESDDCDGDGVSNGDEHRLGTNPSDGDSDHDGYSDFQESVVYGTSPTDSNSYPFASISGTVTYSGLQTGIIRLVAATTSNDWTALHGASSAGLGPYTISNVPLLRTYWVKAYRDTNGNGQKDAWEPYGASVPGSITPTSAVAGVNVPLVDPALDPALDTDGDGMSDASEIRFGMSPFVSNQYARLPFVESFETNTVTVGDIGGQNGWRVSETNAAFVQTNSVYAGSQALELNSSSDSGVTVSQFFANPATNQVWVDVRMRVERAPVPTNRTDSASCFFFDGDNRLVVLDGLQSGTNRWVTLTNSPALVQGSWARVSVQLDFTAQTWLICLNGVKLAEGLGFGSTSSELHSVEQSGRKANADDLAVSSHEPAGLSLDGDTLPDDWETLYFGNTQQTDTGDPDGDGVVNLQEFLHGGNPLVADTDADGMPDGWELAHGFNLSSSSDAAVDADGDGLSNLAEYQNQTDPLLADTDHDGVADGAEVNTWHSNPLLADSDGDTYSDGDEVEGGTNPSDAQSHPASHWRDHLRLTLREGACTNRLTDVPVLVRLTPERIDYAKCAADGRDILFTDAAGAALDFEVDQWTPGGDSLFWVRLPEIGGTNAADHFWVHWNNSEATNSATPAGVWRSNYVGVWHLSQSNAVLVDSSPGSQAATNSGSLCVTGLLGNARAFRGSDSLIVPPASFATISNAVTVSFWQYGATDQPRNNTCFDGVSAVGRELNAHVPWGDSTVYWDAFGNYDRINKLAPSNLYKGVWNHWTCSKDRATGTMTIYANGELWHSGTGKTRTYTPVTAFRFGSAADGSCGYTGQLDELRVETVVRPAVWVRFQYKSMLDQVLIYGEQQVSIVGSGNAAEPSQAGEFTVSRTAQNTNLPLTVTLSVPSGTATEGADFAALPRTVLIPARSLSAPVTVPVFDDLWLEGAETATVTLVQGGTFLNATNSSASILIADNDEDTDSDGLCDAWEIAHFGNLEMAPTGDADSDGVDNLTEFLNGTDPLDPDTDHDGLPDVWEIAQGTDPLVADASADPDKDGLTNAQEYQHGTNPFVSDTDGDGMPDKWEVDHGLNPLANDASLDPDGDGLSNLQEFQRGTNPQAADTDGDGMPDKWEFDNALNPLSPADGGQDPDDDNLTNVEEYLAGANPRLENSDGDALPDAVEATGTLTDPKTATTFVLVSALTVQGNAATNRVGDWQNVGATIALACGRGSLDYGIDVPQAGVYLLDVSGCAYSFTRTTNDYPLALFADGAFVKRRTLRTTGNASGSLRFVLPYMPAGHHTVTIDWENLRDDTGLAVERIQLLGVEGTDGESNGVPDWCEHWLAAGNGVDAVPAATAVSPYCLEGLSRYEMLTTVDGVTVMGTGNRRWYRNVALATSGETVAHVALENGGLTADVRIVWTPLNLLMAPSAMALRAGDTLRVGMWGEGASTGQTQLAVGGVTNVMLAAGAALDVAFPTAGVYEVSGVLESAISTARTMVVTVVGGGFASSPVIWVGKTRGWTCPALTTQAVVMADARLTLSETASPTGRVFMLGIDRAEMRYVCARVSATGTVLDAVAAQGISVDSTGMTAIRTLAQYADGTRLIETPVIVNGLTTGMTVVMQVFIGGVTFEDGTMTKKLTPADFDEYGVYYARFLYPSGISASFCHRLYLYQNDVLVGQR